MTKAREKPKKGIRSREIRTVIDRIGMVLFSRASEMVGCAE